MGNGGIIPTSKTQTVTFFNTTGLIERGKNMYFAPRLSKTLATAGQKLSIAYLNEFKRVCPPFSDYSDMDISGWSPEDRTLVINGNIDDFRLITEVGNCLNYLIITRQVTTNNTTKTYYYSFFITGVTQVGKNSVRVTIEPDDFTNVFYLHNEKVLTSGDITGDYEPFNDKMKNCYVNRQHYNRVKQVNETDYVIDCYINPDRYFDIADGTQITLEFQDGDPYEPVVITGTVVSHLWTSETSPYRLRISIGFFESEIDINDPDNFSTGHYGSTNFIFDYNTDDIVWYPDKPRHLDIDNIKIFLNQPESFKFKYQYRDSKYPLSLFQDNGYVSFSQEEKRIISITDSFSDLPDDLKHKIVNASVNCIAVEFKSCEIIAPYVFQRGDQLNKYTAVRYMSGGLVSEQVERPTPVIMFPFFNIPKEFKKY